MTLAATKKQRGGTLLCGLVVLEQSQILWNLEWFEG